MLGIVPVRAEFVIRIEISDVIPPIVKALVHMSELKFIPRVLNFVKVLIA